jgi:hypothetical protein
LRKEVFLVVRRSIVALTVATVATMAVAGPALAGVGTSPG